MQSTSSILKGKIENFFLHRLLLRFGILLSCPTQKFDQWCILDNFYDEYISRKFLVLFELQHNLRFSVAIQFRPWLEVVFNVEILLPQISSAWAKQFSFSKTQQFFVLIFFITKIFVLYNTLYRLLVLNKYIFKKEKK